MRCHWFLSDDEFLWFFWNVERAMGLFFSFLDLNVVWGLIVRLKFFRCCRLLQSPSANLRYKIEVCAAIAGYFLRIALAQTCMEKLM